MQTLTVERTGDPWVTRYQSVPVPAIGPDDVRVQVAAAGINPLDARLAAGQLKAVLGYRAPFALGHDLAGVVHAVGERVDGFAVGDAVYGRVRDGRIGTFAHFVSAAAEDLAPKPARLSMVQAAAVPLAGLTAWEALVEQAELSAGEEVLIQAGSGGVGTLAIQIARHLGARITTTASAGSRERLKALGADRVVDHRHERFEDIAPCFDVVLHSQGASELRRSLAHMRRGARLISISGPPDAAFAREYGLSVALRAGIGWMSAATRWRAARSGVRYKFLMNAASGVRLRRLTALIDQAALMPVIDHEVAFTQIPRALRYVASARAQGKVVVRIG